MSICNRFHFKKYLPVSIFAFLFLFSAFNGQTQSAPIEKFEYNYFSVPLANFVNEMNNLGMQGWEFITMKDTLVTIRTGPNIMNFRTENQRYCFMKRKIGLQSQELNNKINTIAQEKIDSAYNRTQRFVLATMNQSVKDIFSTEYSDLMKQQILDQIRNEMNKAIEELKQELKKNN